MTEMTRSASAGIFFPAAGEKYGRIEGRMIVDMYNQ